jgi:sugar O-acyltransferase (sialic acid O-acetyltransferase NeuD family)
MSKIGLLGNGGQADEVETFLDDDIEVSFRAVSPKYADGSRPDLINIESPEPSQTSVPVIAAVGTPALRKEMVECWSGSHYMTLISNKSYTSKDLAVGEGSIIAPNATLTTNVIIRDHSLINTGVTIGHDTKIGSYVTISPGANIAGRVEIGDGVFIGIGAIISNGVKIAAGSVIGAGTVVLDDVSEENSVIVGVPGKVIKHNESWLREL